MLAGRAQPPRGHPSPGHHAATSPAGTGAMTATSGRAKSSSWSPVRDEAGGGQWGGQADAGRTPLLPARWVRSLSPLFSSQPRTSCCHRDALRRCAAAPRPAPRGRVEQFKAEPFPGVKNGASAWRERNTKKVHFQQLTQRGGTSPAGGTGVMDAATGDAPLMLQPSPGPPCHGRMGTGPSLPALPTLGPDQG